ncbi:hypothetical protein [Agromyces soli]|uniref:Uncharacterized protein n=1 Tax=Agromyces soli TaxID=659012 RepID=A0ABY4AVJ1_9MICO|nr:hypothetical protein [Agromyces soli]UOE27212.1 hypothetical protein MTP13_05355 [Agromyces soli]
MVSNPYSGYPVTGSWYDHVSYSAGGTDYPLEYGTALPAPAAGTLRTSGGSGEWAAGWYGAAGRRSILMLDTPAPRRKPAEAAPPEGGGDMVAIVFQHQSEFGAARHYAEGETLGWSGASADGADYGGDVHLHVHGLNASGQRVDFTKFIGPTTIPQPTPTEEEIDMLFLIHANDANANPVNRYALVGPGFWFVTSTVAVANNLATRFGSTSGSSASVTWAEWDRAFKAAVSSGFVPASGQTSRTV